MNTQLTRFLEKFIPYAAIGISIAIIIALIVLLSYVFVWGLLLGVIIYLITIVVNYFKGDKKPPPNKKRGRIIEHEKD